MNQENIIEKVYPESRFKHCHNVGLKMYDYALCVLGRSKMYAEEMYLLGMLHDVGYFYNTDPLKHDDSMYEVLNRISNGYFKYMNEIRLHSRFQDKYDTPEMRLLYYGDNTVDAEGNWVTYEDRIKDIENRHGKDSDVYKETIAIINKLKEWGFDDSFGIQS